VDVVESVENAPRPDLLAQVQLQQIVFFVNTLASLDLIRSEKSMAGGKWIADLKATTPLTDAARRVLTVRLEVVRDYLSLVHQESDRDPEHVHQLRVGTRRARAALDIFACCLAPKAYRTGKKTLRFVRRAAGTARDWDVFIMDLARTTPAQNPRQSAGVDFLVGYAFAQRETSQAHLEELGADSPFAVDRLLGDLLASIHKPAEPGLRCLIDLAQPLLSGLLHELDEAANQDLDDYDHLHRVRIIGKRLRYAMEVFADCFAPAFREQLYPAVEDMQEILGRANDSYVAQNRLTALGERIKTKLDVTSKRYKAGLEGLLRRHNTQLPQERARFLDWWKNWQRLLGESPLSDLLQPFDGQMSVLSQDRIAPQISGLSGKQQAG
jgi:CHAD domain-containing protein